MLALVGAVRGLPAAPQQKVLTQDHLSLQRALEGSGVGCRGENMQKACPGQTASCPRPPAQPPTHFTRPARTPRRRELII